MAKAATSNTTKSNTTIVLPVFNLGFFELTLVGDSPLICHAWSTKAKREILDSHMKKGKPAKEAKDPEQEVIDSLYPHPDGGYGFPAVAFKKCAVDACSHVGALTKVDARGAFHISGDLLKIEGAVTPREDMVRINMGKTDIRFRGEFRDWSVRVPIRYNKNALSPEQISHLFYIGGFAIGVGEWRPQRNGTYGMFHVAGQEGV